MAVARDRRLVRLFGGDQSVWEVFRTVSIIMAQSSSPCPELTVAPIRESAAFSPWSFSPMAVARDRRLARLFGGDQSVWEVFRTVSIIMAQSSSPCPELTVAPTCESAAFSPWSFSPMAVARDRRLARPFRGGQSVWEVFRTVSIIMAQSSSPCPELTVAPIRESAAFSPWSFSPMAVARDRRLARPFRGGQSVWEVFRTVSIIMAQSSSPCPELTVAPIRESAAFSPWSFSPMAVARDRRLARLFRWRSVCVGSLSDCFHNHGAIQFPMSGIDGGTHMRKCSVQSLEFQSHGGGGGFGDF